MGADPIMAGRNGPIRAGDLTPELIPALEIVRDGEPVMLRGYVNGSRCLGRIKADVSSIARRFNEATMITADDGQKTYHHDEKAWRDYLSSSALAVLLGLEDDEADVLSGDEDKVLDLLVYLKWRAAPNAETTEDDDDPEATGEDSTTASFSPSLRPSTASDPVSS